MRLTVELSPEEYERFEAGEPVAEVIDLLTEVEVVQEGGLLRSAAECLGLEPLGLNPATAVRKARGIGDSRAPVIRAWLRPVGGA